MDKQRLAYSPEETAELLGISRATVYRMIEAGTLPYKRIKAVGRGRRERIIIPAYALDKWLSQVDEPRCVTFRKQAEKIVQSVSKKRYA